MFAPTGMIEGSRWWMDVIAFVLGAILMLIMPGRAVLQDGE